MPPTHSKNVEGLGGCDCRVRPVHRENSSEPTRRVHLCGNLLGQISQQFCFTGLGKGFQKMRRYSRKIAGDSKQRIQWLNYLPNSEIQIWPVQFWRQLATDPGLPHVGRQLLSCFVSSASGNSGIQLGLLTDELRVAEVRQVVIQSPWKYN